MLIRRSHIDYFNALAGDTAGGHEHGRGAIFAPESRAVWLVIGTEVIGIVRRRVPVQRVRQRLLQLEYVFLGKGVQHSADICVAEDGERHARGIRLLGGRGCVLR